MQVIVEPVPTLSKCVCQEGHPVSTLAKEASRFLRLHQLNFGSAGFDSHLVSVCEKSCLFLCNSGFSAQCQMESGHSSYLPVLYKSLIVSLFFFVLVHKQNVIERLIIHLI